ATSGEGDGHAKPGRALRQTAEIGRGRGDKTRRGDRYLARPGARAYPPSRQRSREADGDRPHDEGGELSAAATTIRNRNDSHDRSFESRLYRLELALWPPRVRCGRVTSSL